MKKNKIMKLAVAGSRLISSLGSIIFSFSVAKEFGVAELGFVMSVFAVVLGGGTILRFGSDLQLLRIISIAYSRHRISFIRKVSALSYVRLLIVSLIFSLLAGIVLYGSKLWPGNLGVIYLALAMLPALSISKVNASVTRAIGKPIISVLYEHQTSMLIAGVIGFFIWDNKNSIENVFFLLFLVLSLVQVIGAFQVFWSVRKGEEDEVLSKEKLKVFNTNFMISALVSYANQWAVILMSAVLLGSGAAGVVTVAQRCAALLSFIITISSIIYAPNFAVLGATDKGKLIEKGKKVTKEMMLIALPIIAIYVVLGRYIIDLFDEKIGIEGYVLLVIFSLAHFVNISFGLVGAALNMSGHEASVKNTAIISSMLGLLSIFIMGKAWGLYGYAVGYGISISLQNILMSLVARKEFGSTFTVLKW